jgi:hypothetical protein
MVIPSVNPARRALIDIAIMVVMVVPVLAVPPLATPPMIVTISEDRNGQGDGEARKNCPNGKTFHTKNLKFMTNAFAIG